MAGEHRGWTVIVEDDRDGGTGGYYLYFESSDGRGFDFWFESEAGVRAQLEDFEIDFRERD